SDGSGESHSTLDFQAKETRLFIRTDTMIDGHKLGTLVEFDFISGQINQTINGAATGSGNENVTNAYNPALRRAYITYDNWLLGQDWTTFQNLNAIPETLDFVAFPSDGTVFARQPQVRYSNGGFAIAVENPETTVSGVGSTDDNILPDLTARYGFKLGTAELMVAGLLRQLKIDNPAVVGPPAVPKRDDDAVGGGVSLSGKIPLGKDDIRFMFTGGDGIGRYVALGTATDAVADGSELDTVSLFAGYIAYRHPWSTQLRSTLALSGISIDNDKALVNTATTTKSVYSAAVNLLYSPVKPLTLGVEYRHAKREVENGNDGALDRLQFSAKYLF
ncbi:MAG: DcaP family trimeric outer membrane transporter, partial [Solimonas sp.]